MTNKIISLNTGFILVYKQARVSPSRECDLVKIYLYVEKNCNSAGNSVQTNVCNIMWREGVGLQEVRGHSETGRGSSSTCFLLSNFQLLRDSLNLMRSGVFHQSLDQ